MDKHLIDEDWRYLCQYLPENLSELAKATGTVQRWRQVKNGEELLRIILYARSYTSVLHRLRQAPPLLEKVLAHLLTQRLRAEAAPGPEFRIHDATVLSLPGSAGTDWRLHAVYDPAQCCLRRLAHARGIHAVTEAGAYVLLRMHWQNIRLHDAQGQCVDMDQTLEKADRGKAGAIVYVPLENKPPVPARLLLRPLPTEAASRNRQRLRRNAAKKGRTPSATALRLAGYFCLLTTLPESLARDDVVLELYRVRWQIELCFKRCKGLLHFDQLRAFDPRLVRTYCLAKLIEVALIQCLHEEAIAFSPWGVPRCRRPAA